MLRYITIYFIIWIAMGSIIFPVGAVEASDIEVYVGGEKYNSVDEYKLEKIKRDAKKALDALENADVVNILEDSQKDFQEGAEDGLQDEEIIEIIKELRRQKSRLEAIDEENHSFNNVLN